MKKFKNKFYNFGQSAGIKIASLIALVQFYLMNPGYVLADTKIDANVPTVNNDGSITFKGSGSGKDVKEGANELLKFGSWGIAILGAFASLGIIGWGIWRYKQVSQEIGDGNTQGWKNLRNTTAAIIIFGVAVAIISILIGIGAATGNNFFKGGTTT